jgi:transposase
MGMIDFGVSGMKRFIEGESRTQSTLLPERLDDYVADANPVRVVDVFVDELDLGKLGFDGVDPAATGRPAYHPATLLRGCEKTSRVSRPIGATLV